MFRFFVDRYFNFIDKEKSHQFILWQYNHSAKQIQYILALTGIIYIIMGIVNLFIFDSDIYYVLIFLQLFFIPSYAFLISFLAYKRINFKTLETLLFLAPIFTSFIHAFVFSHLEKYSSYQTELYLMIFWTFTISGLRLEKAIISSLIVLIVGIYYPFHSYENQQTEFISHSMWMIISILLGVVGAILLHQSKKETFKKELELQKLATIDKLTGLYNRVKLDSILMQELDKAKRYNHTIGILILDIDHFKNVNDTYGHLVGDEILIGISKTIQNNIRSTDYIFRWGGEEFIVICPKMSQNDIIAFAQKIRSQVSKQKFKTVGYKTISIGTTINNTQDNIDSIIHRADEALYEAKATGRNKVCYK